jgi:glutathione S-transferase
VLLRERRVQHETEALNLREPNERQQIKPIGKVPALVLDDGHVLTVSSLIADWIDERYPQPRFIPADAVGRLDVRQTEAIADGVTDAAAVTSDGLRFHDAASRRAPFLRRQQGKVVAGLGAPEGQLDGRRWLCGENVSLADIAIACSVGFMLARAPHLFDASATPGLARMARKLEARESFKATVPRPLSPRREGSAGGRHCPPGGCQSSTLLPSGSITQPNLPNSESSVFSSTLQPSSRSACSSEARSGTR